MTSARHSAGSHRQVLRTAVASVVESLEARRHLTAVKVSFQPSGVSPQSGYLADNGATYADRGNGYSYGWNADNTANMVNDNAIIMVDPKYKTHAQMQPGGVNRTWEIGLANGQYQVKVVAGDYQTTGSTYDVRVEGTQGPSGTPNNYVHWFEKTVVVNVTDGRLTLTNGSGASDQRLSFVEINSVSSLTTPGNAATNLKARPAGSGSVDLVWDDTNSNEAWFEVQRRPPNGTWSTIATTGGGNEYYGYSAKAYYTDTTVSANTAYEYRVRPANGAGATGTWSNAASVSVPSTNARLAYNNGAPRTITDRIEAEDFDVGGSGIGYTDNSVGNLANLYRQTDVDVGVSDTGYFVGWNNANEWTTYTVNVPAAGTYDMTYSLARGSIGGTFQVLLNDNPVGPASIQIPGTGHWQTFEEHTATGFVLPQGQHVLKVKVLTTPSGSGEAGNLDWFQFVQTGAGVSTPTNLTASSVQSTSVSLTWTDNATNETSYRVERKVGTGSWQTLAGGLAANTTSYTDNTVSASTAYAYRVFAVSSTLGDSAASSEALVTTPASPTTTVTFNPNADTYVRNGTQYANENYGTATEILAKLASSAGYTREAYMRFDASSLAGTINSVKLRVYARRNSMEPDGPTLAFSVKAMSNTTWSESTTTFNNKPSTGATLGTINATSQSNLWYEVDVTSYVQAEIAAGRTTISLAVVGAVNNSDSNLYIASREASNKPQLVVEVAALGEDRALNQPTTASSVQASTSHVAANATDGNTTTRWSSEYSDNQWLRVDLGQAYDLSAVRRKWEAAYASAYKIQLSDNDSTWTDAYSTTTSSGGTQIFSVTGTGRYVRLLGVTRATSYGYSVYDFNVYGTPVSAPQAPAAPDNLVLDTVEANSATTASVTLEWADNSSDETGFKIERRLAGGGSWSQIATTNANSLALATYTDTTALADKTYEYRVRATDGVLDSDYSNALAGVATPPATPGGLTLGSVAATAATAATVALTWTNNATTQTGFKLERREASGSWSQIATPGSGATSYSDTAAQSDKTYEYRLRATNSAGDSTYAAALTGVATPPAAPTGLGVTGTTSSSVSLSWTDVSTTETEYRVERRVTGDPSYTTIASGLAANSTSYTDNTVSEGVQYDYRVRAVNSAVGDGWAAGPVQTGANLAAPTGVSVAAAASTAITVTWADNTSLETGYEIDYSTSNTFASGVTTVTTLANAASKLITGLAAGTTYYVRVRAVNGDTASANSSSASATTLGTLGISRSPSGSTNEGTQVTLTPAYASGTAVSGTTYAWTVLKNGSPFASGSGATFAFTPDDEGSYSAAVAATTPSGVVDDGSLSAFNVVNVLPTLTAIGDSTASVGVQYTLELLATDPGSADTITWTIDWDDGSPSTPTGRDLSPGHTYAAPGVYTISISASDGTGVAYPSPATIEVTVSDAVPAAPTNLKVTSLDGNSVRLRWTDNSENETHFKLTYTPSGGTPTTIDLPPNDGSQGEYDLSGLNPETDYEFSIAAYDQSTGQTSAAITKTFRTSPAFGPGPTRILNLGWSTYNVGNSINGGRTAYYTDYTFTPQDSYYDEYLEQTFTYDKTSGLQNEVVEITLSGLPPHSYIESESLILNAQTSDTTFADIANGSLKLEISDGSGGFAEVPLQYSLAEPVWYDRSYFATWTPSSGIPFAHSSNEITFRITGTGFANEGSWWFQQFAFRTQLPAITISANTVTEGDGNKLQFTVSRDLSGTAWVDYPLEVDLEWLTGESTAEEGEDFSGDLPDRITFEPGERTRVIELDVIDDQAPEWTESLRARVKAGMSTYFSNHAIAQGEIVDDLPADIQLDRTSEATEFDPGGVYPTGSASFDPNAPEAQSGKLLFPKEDLAGSLVKWSITNASSIRVFDETGNVILGNMPDGSTRDLLTIDIGDYSSGEMPFKFVMLSPVTVTSTLIAQATRPGHTPTNGQDIAKAIGESGEKFKYVMAVVQFGGQGVRRDSGTQEDYDANQWWDWTGNPKIESGVGGGDLEIDDAAYPISYVRSTSAASSVINVSARFRIELTEPIAMDVGIWSLRGRDVGSGGIVEAQVAPVLFEGTANQIGAKYYFEIISGSFSIPLGDTIWAGKLKVEWTIEHQIDQNNTKKNTYGTTENALYVTGAPVTGVAKFNTVQAIATSKASGRKPGVAAEELDIAKAIYAEFEDRTVKRRNDSATEFGAPLRYWGPQSSNDENEPECFTVEGLLKNNDARCQAWANFYIEMLRVAGLTSQQLITIIPPPPPPKEFIIEHSGYDDVRNIGAFIVVKSLKAQGGDASKAIFPNHDVVEFGGVLFDPSYGIASISNSPKGSGPITYEDNNLKEVIILCEAITAAPAGVWVERIPFRLANTPGRDLRWPASITE